MKAKLYSHAHMKSAEHLFPDKWNDEQWREAQWVDDEINACKLLEFDDFISSPTFTNYSAKNSFFKPQKDFYLVKSILTKNPSIKSFLSIGCGPADKELRLAKEFPHIKFTAIDNAPYVESLNYLAKEMGISNIKFFRKDLRDINREKFDLVFSFAVIYCIPDDGIKNFFDSIMQSLNVDGVAIVGCSGNYSLKIKFLKLIKVFMPRNQSARKLIGWVRDVNHVKRFLPKKVFLEETHFFSYKDFNTPKTGFLTSCISSINSFVSKQNYLFIIKHKL